MPSFRAARMGLAMLIVLACFGWASGLQAQEHRQLAQQVANFWKMGSDLS